MNRTITIVLALLVSACGQTTDEQATEPVTSAEPAVSIYDTAVGHTARPESDRARDTGRKPAEILKFFGIAPGMTVLDMFSGGGYYTEILSYVVGEKGRVVAHSNAAYLNFVGEEFEQRYLGGRLPNTEVLMAENNELALEADSFDAIMLVLSFHDLYYEDADSGWPRVDVETLLAELHKALRAGGIVGVIDHFAANGSPSETGGTTHRIDPAIVVEAMTLAGFVLEAQDDMLRNPADDYDKIVFDPEVQGKTDRFVMRFRKPE